MYENGYDDYIKTVLGYSKKDNENYENEYLNSDMNVNTDLEKFYPEIYKIIYPMVKKSLEKNENLDTDEKIEKVVEDIYSAFEGNVEESSEAVVEEDEVITKTEVHENHYLKELIKILLIREILKSMQTSSLQPQIKQPVKPYQYSYNIYER